MKIAIVGTRGIPNRYGGFERFAEQISSRFADHGHEVTVYCRRAFTRPDDEYDRRVKRVIVPSLHQKHLDTWVSTFFAAVHAAFSRYDVVLICNVANAPFCYLPRMFGTPVVLNVDGLDRKRSKWNALGAAGAALLRVDVELQFKPVGDGREDDPRLLSRRSTARNRL